MSSTRQPQQGQPLQIVPSLSTTGALLVRGAKTFARKNKVITGSYLFGLIVLLLAGSGTKLTYDQVREYNRIMSSIDLDLEYEAANDFAVAKTRYQRSKGWLPFSCNEECQFYKGRMESASVNLENIRREGYNRMSDAKSTAGLFSEVGVGEVKDAFWDYFTNGKKFAKRQTMWDMLFIGMRSMGRDESFLQYAFEILLKALINFSLGLIMTFFIFIFGLWSIIKSYQANPLTAVVFFVMAACAGFAFVTSYLMAIYGAAAASIYGVAKIAENRLLLEQQGGGAARQRARVQHSGRPHYE